MSHPAILLKTATTHHQAGRLADAERAYRKLLQIEAVNVDGLRLLGGLYLQTGQADRAIECLEQAARLSPADPETLTNLGVALRMVGRREEALERCQQALAIDPDYVSALANIGSIYQDKGQATEALDAFGRVLRLAPDNATAHFNYGNALCGVGRGREATMRYEHALKLKPDYLEAMVNLGIVLSQLGKAEQSQQWLSTAQGWFEKALKVDPANIAAMNNLGNILRQRGKAEEALAYYKEALRLQPDYAQAVLNMATCLRDLNRYDEALENCRAVLQLLPESSDARINLGTFLQDLSRHDEAVAYFDEALRIKPASIDAKWDKALSLLCLGHYQEGWALHETGLGVAHMRGEYPSPQRRWHGENFAGKRLLIWCEQGLGDSLQFIRYAELAKSRGGTVIVHCQRPLRSLFQNCPFIDELPDSVEEKDFDFHVPTMSLPFVFDTRLDSIPAHIPYLFISDKARARWADKFPESKNFKVGLVWAGNPRENQINAHRIDKRRSVTLDMLRPLFDVQGVDFYNLQMGAGMSQSAHSDLWPRLIDHMGGVLDFEDTGAIIEHLDLVIAVDTSVVHLAGGMGKPVWVMSRFDACWRWLQNRSDSPWYPAARVFGQKTPGDWAGVVERVRDELYNASITTKACAQG